MKNITRTLSLLIPILLLMGSAVAFAQRETGEDKTLSPYFFVKSDDPDLDQLPLKSTSAHVRISGVIADVAVTQVYKNEGERPIEVNGDLTETSVRSTVMKELEAINRCVKKTGIEKSSLKGEGVFALLVGPDGGVKEVRVEKGSAVPEDLSRCIQKILRTMKLQADPGRRDILLKLTLSFD